MSDASDASDSQNRPETPVADIPEAGTSPDPSSSSDDGERSTPSGMPPAATRDLRAHQRRATLEQPQKPLLALC
jgi:hypothetical protein